MINFSFANISLKFNFCYLYVYRPDALVFCIIYWYYLIKFLYLLGVAFGSFVLAAIPYVYVIAQVKTVNIFHKYSNPLEWK
jgi:hypothetical protein